MKLISINKIKPNPSNPRVIKDNKFQQLKKSLEEFPEMAEARGVVIDENFMILGGNMRWRAAKELGWKEINAIQVTGWTEDQKRQFIIKDNVGFGEWDWEIIAADWPEVGEWGLDVPDFNSGDILELPSITTTYNVNIKCDSPIEVEELKERLGISSNSIHVIELYKLMA